MSVSLTSSFPNLETAVDKNVLKHETFWPTGMRSPERVQKKMNNYIFMTPGHTPAADLDHVI